MTYKEGANRMNYKKGSKKDDCQTPGYALEPLFSVLTGYPPALSWTVWEPAVGEGLLADSLSGAFDKVVTTPDTDFLDRDSPVPDFSAIITNPPFSLRIEFLERCIELDKPFALLMPTETVSLKSFHEALFHMEMDMGIIWFSPRVNFKMPNKGWEGSSYFPVAWFVGGLFDGNVFMVMNHWTKEFRERFEV